MKRKKDCGVSTYINIAAVLNIMCLIKSATHTSSTFGKWLYLTFIGIILGLLYFRNFCLKENTNSK